MNKKLIIDWIYDKSPDCETCGPSYAMGYRAYLDGVLISHFDPIAACFDGESIEEQDAMKEILSKLGIELEFRE